MEYIGQEAEGKIYTVMDFYRSRDRELVGRPSTILETVDLM